MPSPLSSRKAQSACPGPITTEGSRSGRSCVLTRTALPLLLSSRFGRRPRPGPIATESFRERTPAHTEQQWLWVPDRRSAPSGMTDREGGAGSSRSAASTSPSPLWGGVRGGAFSASQTPAILIRRTPHAGANSEQATAQEMRRRGARGHGPAPIPSPQGGGEEIVATVRAFPEVR